MSAQAISGLDHGWVFLLCCLGFTALALAMARHQEDIVGRELNPRASAGLRWAGWLLLAGALLAIVRSMGWAFGLVAYSGHTSAAAGAVFLGLLAFRQFRSRS